MGMGSNHPGFGSNRRSMFCRRSIIALVKRGDFAQMTFSAAELHLLRAVAFDNVRVCGTPIVFAAGAARPTMAADSNFIAPVQPQGHACGFQRAL
jgi:hypothetical protein